MSCGAGVLGEPNLSNNDARHAIGIAATQGTQTPSFVFGTAASNVADVKVELNNGDVLYAKTLSAPEALKTGIRFYVIELPANIAVAAVTANDEKGSLIEKLTLPPPPER